MTADDITSQRFARQFLFGLNSEEVSAFLQDVAEAYQELQRRNRVLAASVKTLQSDIDPLIAKETHTAEEADTICDAAAQADSMIKAASDKETPTKPIAVLRAVALQEVEELLHDARIEAQALIDSAREREAAALRDIEAAKTRIGKEADDLISEARLRAESLVATARDEETAIRKEIEGLSESRLRLIDDVWATLETYQQWLATADPRGRAPGRREVAMRTSGSGKGVGPREEMRAG